MQFEKAFSEALKIALINKHITITTPHSEFLTSLVRVNDDTLSSAGTDKKVNFYLLNSDTGSYEIEPKMTISELS